jgi:hypothetical protein
MKGNDWYLPSPKTDLWLFVNHGFHGHYGSFDEDVMKNETVAKDAVARLSEHKQVLIKQTD